MLCRADKSPFWRGWQHHRAPLDEIEHHQIQGLPVGVIPWSLRASGLDVDWGNPSDFATAYPPMARLPQPTPWRPTSLVQGYPAAPESPATRLSGLERGSAVKDGVSHKLGG